jgi:oligopeptide transport system permease protein
LGQFVVRRVARMVITLAVATFVFFSAVTVLPGDPVRGLFGFTPPPPDVYAIFQADYHLDQPFLAQYGLFMTDLLRGDFGYSFPDNPWGRTTLGPPVSAILRATLPVSLRIIGGALAVQVLVGLSVGVFAALRRRRLSGVTAYATGVLLVSAPVIVVAYGLQAFAGLNITWLPYSWRPGGGWTNYIQPVAALSAGFAGYLLLLTRAELLATLRRPFIGAATGRGISHGRIVGIHALRASLVPVIAYVTANVGSMIAALVIVEGIFGVPGAGGAMFRALARHDRPLIVVLIMLILMLVIVVNTLADIAYTVIDPRIRLRRE